ncbi:MAG TPA: hypothetical protein VFF63_04150 [Candidatus Babeliales bacterium]|nr:hypothetical protein [Candidatus Babeliales bacterium]
MKTLKLRLGVLLFALFFAAALGAGTALAVQTHMVNARNDLQSALSELQAAQADKAGHRENAIGLINKAIEQVNLGIQAAQ